jgi:hypothetical protein
MSLTYLRAALLVALIVASSLAVTSCDRETPRAPDQTQSATDTVTARAPTPTATPDTVALGVHRPVELDDAARVIVAFLWGEVPFDSIHVADTVTFYMSPEGGGRPRTVARQQLPNRANWTIRGPSPADGRPGILYSFTPSKRTSELTTRVGRHFNCREYPLASRNEELAQLPHVGVMLSSGDSCLQTRNFTLVFDPAKRPPTLVAALYDQWEW